MDFYGENLSKEDITALDAWLGSDESKPFWRLLQRELERNAGHALNIEEADTTQYKVRYHFIKWLQGIPAQLHDEVNRIMSQ